MKLITSAQFLKNVEADPSWAAKLSQPVKVTNFCNMEGTAITHLSPLLIFGGQSIDGTAASFANCQFLKTAEGVFDGAVYFDHSAITGIGELAVRQEDRNGMAASFNGCRRLKEARGTFAGAVRFSESGVAAIADLIITRATNSGVAAQFIGCKHLKEAKGTYYGSVNFSESGVESIGDLQIMLSDHDGLAALFEDCKKLRIARGYYSGFASFDRSSVSVIEDFVVSRSADDDCAIPEASFIGCPIRWKEIKLPCLLAIIKQRYHGIWEAAADTMVARENVRIKAREALYDPGIEL
ncbi:MAG: hypothetical protein H7A49_08150 [Akkermansiaceae bacterium]|nr:hypothetical protein [Akkermansiaceae bacterium]